MPEYGKLEYWQNRYAQVDAEPFDWMCDYNQLEPLLLPLISGRFSSHHQSPSRPSPKILIVGCGNAPFSHDFASRSGYGEQSIHIDYCPIVIQQQKSRFPDIDFRVVDALDMGEFLDSEFDVVIDKSLLDTTMCYENGTDATKRLFKEIHRVLRPGGRLISVSLHDEASVVAYKSSSLEESELSYEFVVSSCKIPNLRRNDHDEYDIRSLYHTVAVFDKVQGLDLAKELEIRDLHPIEFQGDIISDDDLLAMIHSLSLSSYHHNNDNCSDSSSSSSSSSN